MDVIEVVPFASARVHELSEIHRASGYEAHGEATRLKRRKNFHLRRRTNAYNSRKFPVRLRLKSKRLPTQEPRCRKHRRREILRQKLNHLPTHRWMVKRMKMHDMYGLKLPLHRLDRGVSAALAAPCTISDVSYQSLVQVTGPSMDIMLDMLSICVDGDLPMDTLLRCEEVANVMLYHPNCFPLQAIGPAHILWSSQTLWLWIHPSIVEETLHALHEASTDYPSVTTFE
jgi:hypothetical protein